MTERYRRVVVDIPIDKASADVADLIQEAVWDAAYEAQDDSDLLYLGRDWDIFCYSSIVEENYDG